MQTNDSVIIQNTIAFVQETLKNAEGGHDWWHIYRVHVNAKRIAANENVNGLVVELAALLHDISDSKFNGGNETLGAEIARDFLTNQKLDSQIIEHVVQIINHIYSYSIHLDDKTYERVIATFNHEQEKRCIRLESEAEVNIKHSLKNIINNLQK